MLLDPSITDPYPSCVITAENAALAVFSLTFPGFYLGHDSGRKLSRQALALGTGTLHPPLPTDSGSRPAGSPQGLLADNKNIRRMFSLFTPQSQQNLYKIE
jgi:hypothetical protein